jgi:hypothetical protein
VVYDKVAADVAFVDVSWWRWRVRDRVADADLCAYDAAPYGRSLWVSARGVRQVKLWRVDRCPANADYWRVDDLTNQGWAC